MIRAPWKTRAEGALARPRIALGVVVLILLVANLVTTGWLSDGDALVGLAATGSLLVVARVAGLSWMDLGLARATLGIGLRWTAAAVVLVGLGYAILLLVPEGSSLLADGRTPSTFTSTLWKAVVTIPLRTVLLEEIGFRGVLWALLRRQYGTRAATVWSSLAFGAWHVPPAIAFASASEVTHAAIVSSPLTTAGVVIATVVFTSAAGVLLCELRRRSGSLLPPIGLHWAANGLGTLAAFSVS